MPETTNELLIPHELIVADAASFAAKMSELRAHGADGMHAVFDFDRTLTVKRPGTQDEVTTWHILREHLPQDGQMEYQRLFNKYRRLELSGTMTEADAIQWWSAILNLFVERGVDLAAVEEAFMERASIRPGTFELFELFAGHGIPTVILSAGIRDVIDMWCRKYRIEPTLVVSTSLVVDDCHRITGWEQDTLVHVLNKSEATHPELTSIRKLRPNALVVGDGLDDASMSPDGHGVIKVRILDPRDDESDNEQEEHKSFERFDAVIKTGTLTALCELVGLVA